MRKQLTLIAALLGLALSANAQAKDDFLAPATGYFTSFAHQQQYYPRVAKVLLHGLSDTPTARVVVLPSFAAEYVVSVENQNNKPVLRYQISEEQIWHKLSIKDNSATKVKSYSVGISPELAAAIGKVFNLAIDQVRYPAPQMTMRADGTTFHFQSFRAGLGLRGGEAWSPAQGSRLAALTELVDQLGKLATQNGPATEAELLMQANALATRFQ